MRRLINWLFKLHVVFVSQFALADDIFFDSLPQVEAAPDILVIEGRQELFDSSNHGAIANSILIDSDRGVLVIDTGSNKIFGDWLRRIAEKHFGKPVVAVINTHGHPDHWFGNAAFRDIPKFATKPMIDYSKNSGPDLLITLYAAVGDAMVGTQLDVPDLVLGSTLTWGRFKFDVISSSGHSDGDAAFFDSASGVLIAGDLVFNGRCPTTPHANVSAWVETLNRMEARAPQVIIPGHGSIDSTVGSIRETRDYLQWLDSYLRKAAKDAVDPAELISQGVPERWAHLKVVNTEFSRSVIHLFSKYESEYAVKVPVD